MLFMFSLIDKKNVRKMKCLFVNLEGTFLMREVVAFL